MIASYCMLSSTLYVALLFFAWQTHASIVSGPSGHHVPRHVVLEHSLGVGPCSLISQQRRPTTVTSLKQDPVISWHTVQLVSVEVVVVRYIV